jgi:hypothetical protein
LKRIMFEILGGVPFLLATDTGGMKLNYARIVEALIIAGVGGFFAAQLTMGELKTKLTYLEGQNSRMEQQISATCNIVQDQMRELTRIDTLQKERIERDRRNK